MDDDDLNDRPLAGWRKKLQIAVYGLSRSVVRMMGLRVETVGEQVWNYIKISDTRIISCLHFSNAKY